MTNQTEWNPLYTYTIPSIPAAQNSPSSPINITRNMETELGYLQRVRDQLCFSFPIDQFDLFSRNSECPHNLMHVFMGGFIAEYSSSSQLWTAFDSLFWFFHANFDRIWAAWEEQNDDFTSAFLTNDTTFYPYNDWTFEQLSDYKSTMYYTYDSTFTTDFCQSQQPGSLSLVAQFTQLPISHNEPYSLRLIIDPERLVGRSNADTNITNDDIVAEIGMWRATPAGCVSPNCTAWCSFPIDNKYVHNADARALFSKPFDISDALFVEVYGKDRQPIDLSSGIRSNDLRARLNNLPSNVRFPIVRNPQLAYGTVPTASEYLASVQVSDDKTSAFIHWTFQSPETAEYPPINVAAGANLTFNYNVAGHSVAQVFEWEFRQCGPRPIIPYCLPQPGVSGKVNCTIPLPAGATNTTFFFICTQTDHCSTRGMRLRVTVGDGQNIVSRLASRL